MNQHLKNATYLKFFLSFIFLLSLALPVYANQDERIYVNKNYGYTFDRDGFLVDDSNETIKTTFYTDYTYVDVFYENFSNKNISSLTYTSYSNKFIKNSDYVKIQQNGTMTYKGHNVRIIKWKRKALKNVDKNYTDYMLLDIKKNNKEVYTIYVSSMSPIDTYYYLDRFDFIQRNPSATLNYKVFNRKENELWSEETKDFYYNDFHQTEKTKLGIYDHSISSGVEDLKNVENAYHIVFPYVLDYFSMSASIDVERLNTIYRDGKILEFSFQTSMGSSLKPEMIYQILDGEHDEHIEHVADSLSKLEGPVFFRLNNEMNGDWCSYNALHFQRDTRLYIDLWKYIYRKIREKGGENVIFVFNPNEKSFPDFKWNSYMEYFPGEEYVDVIGVTGYNTGTYYKGETWRSFRTIYDAFMPDYKRRFQGYDFFITEFGSSVYGGDRLVWLEDMLDVISDYGFKVAIYWNGTDWDYSNIQNGEPTAPVAARVYRVENDGAAMKIISDYMKSLVEEE